jgi:hypothetical protein
MPVVVARSAGDEMHSSLGPGADHFVDPGPLGGAAHDVAVKSDLGEGERACCEESHKAQHGDGHRAQTCAPTFSAANHRFSSRDWSPQLSSA